MSDSKERKTLFYICFIIKILLYFNIVFIVATFILNDESILSYLFKRYLSL